jgi:hypothetical protein
MLTPLPEKCNRRDTVKTGGQWKIINNLEHATNLF